MKRERPQSSHLNDIADTAQTKSRLLHTYFQCHIFRLTFACNFCLS